MHKLKPVFHPLNEDPGSHVVSHFISYLALTRVCYSRDQCHMQLKQITEQVSGLLE